MWHMFQGLDLQTVVLIGCCLLLSPFPPSLASSRRQPYVRAGEHDKHEIFAASFSQARLGAAPCAEYAATYSALW